LRGLGIFHNRSFFQLQRWSVIVFVLSLFGLIAKADVNAVLLNWVLLSLQVADRSIESGKNDVSNTCSIDIFTKRRNGVCKQLWTQYFKII